MPLINKALLLIINTLRPLLGPPASCRFAIPCTDFARIQLKEHTFFYAVWSISIRILSCNPIAAILNLPKQKKQLK